MSQRVAGGFVIAPQDVDEENILPGMAAHGPRFDLAEVDIAQGEDAERLEENARQILQGKANGRFVGSPTYLPQLADLQEASVVLLVILNAGQQYASTVLLRGLRRRNRSGVVQFLGNDVAHAPRRVVERHRLDLRTQAEETDRKST